MQSVFEKIIEKLDKERSIFKTVEWNVAMNKAIEIVKQAEAEYNGGWIPCSEGLPEEYGEYLCCDRYGEYIIGYPTQRISSINSFYVETEAEIMNDCIAWQPLPDPYQTNICDASDCPINDGIECPAAEGCAGYQPKGE